MIVASFKPARADLKGIMAIVFVLGDRRRRRGGKTERLESLTHHISLSSRALVAHLARIFWGRRRFRRALSVGFFFLSFESG